MRDTGLNLNMSLFETFAILALTISSYLAWKYSGQPLLDLHDFRQTQTALTSYWFTKENFSLAYQTPVAGAPWSIPFEFPIFQLLVAILSDTFSLPLDKVGRLTSYAFLIATIFPVQSINRKLGFSNEVFVIFVALLFSMPVYIYWSRTFMIETAALFFTVCALNFFCDYLTGDHRHSVKFFLLLFASLAILQKAPTAIPALILMASALLIFHVKAARKSHQSFINREAAIGAILIAAPIAIGLAWVKFTDHVKSANPMGQQLTSAALTEWNWGTPSQRLSHDLWVEVIWNRIFDGNMGSVFGVVLLALPLLLPIQKKVKVVVASAIILGIAPLFIFTNLHIVHTYYQSSNLIFLAYALAVSLGAVILPKLGQPITAMIVLIIMILNYLSFALSYFPHMMRTFSKENRNLAVGTILKRELPEGSQFVAFGNDWNSTFSYFSGRKSFTVPQFFREYEQAASNPERFVEEGRLGGYVNCSNQNVNVPQFFAKLGDKSATWKVGESKGCLIAVRAQPQEPTISGEARCRGDIDKIGIEKLNNQVFLSFQGWTTLADEKLSSPDDVVLVITQEDAHPRYFQTIRVYRGEINKTLQISSESEVGFSRILSTDMKPGKYEVDVIQHVNEEYKTCGIRRIFNVR